MGIDSVEFVRLQQSTAIWEEIADHLHHLLTLLTEGVLSIDKWGCISYVSSSASKILGYQRDELLGRNMHLTLQHARADGISFPEDASAIHQALREGRERHAGHEVFWGRFQKPIPVEYVATPFSDAGTVCGVMVSFHGTCDQAALQEVRRKVRSSRSFATTGSNRLNAQLTVALTYCQLLLTRVTADDPAFDLVAQIHSAATELAGAIRKCVSCTQSDG